jgi:hypothetical protein
MLHLLVIDNVELVDNEFKLLKMVVDVLFKLVIDNVELVDNEFKLLKMVVDVLFKLVILEFIVNTDKPDAFTSPTTFNVDKHDTALFNVVVPDTFNDDMHVVELFNVVVPDIFKLPDAPILPVIFKSVLVICNTIVLFIGSS